MYFLKCLGFCSMHIACTHICMYVYIICEIGYPYFNPIIVLKLLVMFISIKREIHIRISRHIWRLGFFGPSILNVSIQHYSMVYPALIVLSILQNVMGRFVGFHYPLTRSKFSEALTRRLYRKIESFTEFIVILGAGITRFVCYEVRRIRFLWHSPRERGFNMLQKI